MEKYAVDPNDPNEKRAEELIKTGKQENLSEAREEASKNDDKSKKLKNPNRREVLNE